MPSSNAVLACRYMLMICMLFLAGTGCSTTHVYSPPPKATYMREVKSIYIYSFLDLREGYVGSNFQLNVRRMLAEALDRKGVRNAQLWFNESPLRAQYILEAKRVNSLVSSTRIPVNEVIAENQSAERAFGDTHRLIIFPVFISSANGQTLQVRWDVYNTLNNYMEWSTTTETFRTIWWSADENAVERAREFVDSIISEMVKSGVLK